MADEKTLASDTTAAIEKTVAVTTEVKDGIPVSTDSDQTESVTPQKLQAKKIGHRRVDKSTGQTTYKKTPSSALSGSIQLGISHTVAGLSAKPERDVLMQDFQVVETISFPVEGTNSTPAHHYEDFTFRTYAPTAFRYFRDLFGIQPDDYMLSISRHPLTELSNPGASGSLFFVTHDDKFIIKTVQHKEAEFLQKLLPGYYMNLVQNPKTFLPKFYGLYCVQASGKNIRVCVMNNLLPRKIKMHIKFDLKGSRYKRKASKHERAKKNPTLKDLDLLSDMPDGLILEPEIHTDVIKTIQRDCMVLRSFKIMDYSMLLALHRLDNSGHDKKIQETKFNDSMDSNKNLDEVDGNRRSSLNSDDTTPSTSANYGSRSLHPVGSSTLLRYNHSEELDHWSGGIPAKTSRGEKLLLFCGIIDILQCYKLKKKIEHTWKSVITDGDTVSVHRPGFYCERFQKFMEDHVFKRTVVKSQPSTRVRQSQRKQHVASGAPQERRAPSTVTTSSDALARLQGRPDLVPKDEFERAKASNNAEAVALTNEKVTSPDEVSVSVSDHVTSSKNLSTGQNGLHSKRNSREAADLTPGNSRPPSKVDSAGGSGHQEASDGSAGKRASSSGRDSNGSVEVQLKPDTTESFTGAAATPGVDYRSSKGDELGEYGTAF